MEVAKIYAIIETGGKQYKVNPGQTIDVERMDIATGDCVEIERVLLIAQGEKVTVGSPTVCGARVLATSQGEVKGKKIVVFKYKPKVRYRKKMGHRQVYTRLTIDKIIEPEATKSEQEKKSRRRDKKVTADGT